MHKSARGHRPAQGTNARRHVHVAPGPVPFARTPAPDLSRTARVRLAMLDWHHGHGENVGRTARHFGFSRPTLYRWFGRYERHRLESLERWRAEHPDRRV